MTAHKVAQHVTGSGGLMTQLLAEPGAESVLRAIVDGLRKGRISVFTIRFEKDGVRRVHVGFNVPDYYVIEGGEGIVVIHFFDKKIPGAKKVLKRGKSYSKVSLPASIARGKEGPVLGEVVRDEQGRTKKIILYLG